MNITWKQTPAFTKKTLNEQDRFEPEIVEATFHFDN